MSGAPPAVPGGLGAGEALVTDLRLALDTFDPCRRTAQRWGRTLAQRLLAGGRLVAAGNGGSAAQAQHVTAELVGRFRDDRPPFAAVSLTSDTSTLTALANDYGVEEMFARQVRAHARPGDVVLLLSTSGHSANLLRAAAAAHDCAATTWAMTGPAGNPLAAAADDALSVESRRPSTVQELHLLALHVLCTSFDEAVAR